MPPTKKRRRSRGQRRGRKVSNSGDNKRRRANNGRISRSTKPPCEVCEESCVLVQHDGTRIIECNHCNEKIKHLSYFYCCDAHSLFNSKGEYAGGEEPFDLHKECIVDYVQTSQDKVVFCFMQFCIYILESFGVC